MQYQSDYLGRMQWIIYPDGEKIIYGYDEGGQVTSVEGSHYNQTFPYVTKILYDQYGQRTRIEYGNGTATDYTYNPERRWLETVKTKNKYGQSYQNIRYDFDRVGNVRSYVNDCMDTLSGNYRTDQSYGYDDLYQLIHVTGNTEYYPAISSVPDYKSTYTQDFAFDDKGLGNMMSKVSKETVSPLKVIGDNLNYNIGYVYDENYAHRLVQAGNRYYKYDANGNIICEQDGSFDGSENDVSYYKVEQHAEDVYSTDNGWGLFKDESGEARGQARKYRRTYTWNSRNQLVSSVDANYSTSYVYGQDGQRSNKYTQGSETLYFNKMWTLHTDNGNSVYGGQYAKNVYLGETRIVTKLARADQKTAHEEMYKQYYYHSDHLGSATMISDWEGKEYQRIEYTPYGETWVEKTNNSGSEFLPYKFTGKEVDQETGLYYYGARYLDPKYSMWISTDPALGEYVPEMGKGNAKDSGSLPGMGGVFNHINGNLYAYGANNPVRFVDPDGRKNVPFEVQQKLRQYTSFKDYNHIQKCKKGPMDFPEQGLLTQKVDGEVKFDTACIYFSVINSFLMAGNKRKSYIPPDLSTFVDITRGNYDALIKTVFGLDVIYKEIPEGLDETQLKETIGKNPAVLIFTQADFWKNNKENKSHGIAYFDGNMFEPYMGRESTDFTKVRGQKDGNETKLTDYIKGFYFEIKD